MIHPLTIGADHGIIGVEKGAADRRFASPVSLRKSNRLLGRLGRLLFLVYDLDNETGKTNKYQTKLA